LFFENSTETEYLFEKKAVEKQHIRRGKKQKQLEKKQESQLQKIVSVCRKIAFSQ